MKENLYDTLYVARCTASALASVVNFYKRPILITNRPDLFVAPPFIYDLDESNFEFFDSLLTKAMEDRSLLLDVTNDGDAILVSRKEINDDRYVKVSFFDVLLKIPDRVLAELMYEFYTEDAKQSITIKVPHS